jgi:hypothetical protein
LIVHVGVMLGDSLGKLLGAALGLLLGVKLGVKLGVSLGSILGASETTMTGKGVNGGSVATCNVGAKVGGKVVS